eukprot:3601487-Prymnesium_polylepis.1
MRGGWRSSRALRAIGRARAPTTEYAPQERPCRRKGSRSAVQHLAAAPPDRELAERALKTLSSKWPCAPPNVMAVWLPTT